MYINNTGRRKGTFFYYYVIYDFFMSFIIIKYIYFLCPEEELNLYTSLFRAILYR